MPTINQQQREQTKDESIERRIHQPVAYVCRPLNRYFFIFIFSFHFSSMTPPPTPPSSWYFTRWLLFVTRPARTSSAAHPQFSNDIYKQKQSHNSKNTPTRAKARSLGVCDKLKPSDLPVLTLARCPFGQVRLFLYRSSRFTNTLLDRTSMLVSST